MKNFLNEYLFELAADECEKVEVRCLLNIVEQVRNNLMNPDREAWRSWNEGDVSIVPHYLSGIGLE